MNGMDLDEVKDVFLLFATMGPHAGVCLLQFHKNPTKRNKFSEVTFCS